MCWCLFVCVCVCFYTCLDSRNAGFSVLLFASPYYFLSQFLFGLFLFLVLSLSELCPLKRSEISSTDCPESPVDLPPFSSPVLESQISAVSPSLYLGYGNLNLGQ